MKKNKKKKRKIVGYYYNGYEDKFEILYEDVNEVNLILTNTHIKQDIRGKNFSTIS